ELGLASFAKPAWGEIVYATTQGSSRLTAESKTHGNRRSSPWFGVLFSSGNNRLSDGIAAGRFAGIPSRVIELSAPLTESAQQSKKLENDLLPRCYGWLRPAMLRANALDDVRKLIAPADKQRGIPPPGGHGGTTAVPVH